MCGRLSLIATGDLISDLFALVESPDWDGPRYNLAPTQDLFCVVQEDAGRVGQALRWGLVPTWAKDLKVGYRLINARSETAASKNSFRSAFKRRRCLIVTDGFYEWDRQGKVKLPWRIGMDDWQPFALAGLWERWKSPDDEWIRTCTILTTQANPLVGRIHDRMPCILPRSAWDTWLDRDLDDADALGALLAPAPTAAMAMVRVSTHVNNARHEDARAAAPLDGDEAELVRGADLAS